MKNFRPSELRTLQYLDQRGPTHRHTLAGDIINSTRKSLWNQALTRLAGKLTFRLRQAGLVEENRCKQGFHKSYNITEAGAKAIRNLSCERQENAPLSNRFHATSDNNNLAEQKD
jgi:DNA-binding MarR family transcriptional regulator